VNWWTCENQIFRPNHHFFIFWTKITPCPLFNKSNLHFTTCSILSSPTFTFHFWQVQPSLFHFLNKNHPLPTFQQVQPSLHHLLNFIKSNLHFSFFEQKTLLAQFYQVSSSPTLALPPPRDIVDTCLHASLCNWVTTWPYNMPFPLCVRGKQKRAHDQKKW